jgi:cytochrome c biogenesis protein
MVDGEGKKREKWSMVWRWLGSVKLALFLFLALGLSSIIGTLLPQGVDPALLQGRYGETTLALLRFFGLFDLFHSWWFLSILCLLSINLVVCSFQRLPSILKVISLPPVKITEKQEKAFPLRSSSVCSAEDPQAFVGAVFRKRGYRLRWEGAGPPLYAVASKGRWTRLGPYIVHLSILFVLFGATIGAVLGFRGYMNIPEGETVDSLRLEGGKDSRQLGFSVRCDAFEASYYEGTRRPKEYKSQLTIIEGNREVLKKAVVVNDPLSYRGIYFYQSSFGQTGSVKSITLSLTESSRNEPRYFRVSAGESFPLEGTAYSIQMIRFLPDFAMDERFSAFSRSEEFNNPAAEIEVRKGGHPLFRTWVFSKFGEFHGPKEENLRLRLLGFEPWEYTGLQVTHDPGIGWVWSGFALMVFGLGISLFAAERRVWIRAVKAEGKWDLQLSGQSRKGKEMFEREFKSICHELEAQG